MQPPHTDSETRQNGRKVEQTTQQAARAAIRAHDNPTENSQDHRDHDDEDNPPPIFRPLRAPVKINI
jgi:hypothetical protein